METGKVDGGERRRGFGRSRCPCSWSCSMFRFLFQYLIQILFQFLLQLNGQYYSIQVRMEEDDEITTSPNGSWSTKLTTITIQVRMEEDDEIGALSNGIWSPYPLNQEEEADQTMESQSSKKEEDAGQTMDSLFITETWSSTAYLKLLRSTSLVP